MSSKRTLGAVVVSLTTLFTLAHARPAQAAVIDFESLAEFELVTNQFAGLGVVFENAVVLEAFSSLNEIDFPPSSGLRVISGSLPGPVSAELAPGVLGLRFQITTFDVALVQYFDAFDVLISQVAVPANLGTNTLVQFISGGSAIASVSIASQAGGNAFALIIDDFETLTAAAAVPEPKALLLLGPALMVFGAACRRRR